MSKKTKTLLLCFFLGGLGVHQFYIGNRRKGVGYLLLLLILPLGGIVAIIDFIILSLTDSKEFENRKQKII